MKGKLDEEGNKKLSALIDNLENSKINEEKVDLVKWYRKILGKLIVYRYIHLFEAILFIYKWK